MLRPLGVVNRRASTSGPRVATRATAADISARPPVQCVVAQASVEPVGSETAFEDVVTVGALKGIASATATKVEACDTRPTGTGQRSERVVARPTTNEDAETSRTTGGGDLEGVVAVGSIHDDRGTACAWSDVDRDRVATGARIDADKTSGQGTEREVDRDGVGTLAGGNAGAARPGVRSEADLIGAALRLDDAIPDDDLVRSLGSVGRAVLGACTWVRLAGDEDSTRSRSRSSRPSWRSLSTRCSRSRTRRCDSR